MDIKPFFSSGLSSNIYLVKDNKNLLIDAGMEPLGLKPDILILTHSHFDHSAMARDLQEKTGCEVWMSEDEASFFEKNRSEASASRFSDFDVDLGFEINKRLKDNEVVDLGNTKLQVLVTPGHTPGGLCLYEQKSKTLFSGDTVFARGFGRYDLPGGDAGALKKSLNRLATLDIKKLYPGHGPMREEGISSYLKSVCRLL